MAVQEETGQVTGTKGKDHDVTWFTEQCLGTAEQGKLLRSRLAA